MSTAIFDAKLLCVILSDISLDETFTAVKINEAVGKRV